MEENNQYGAPIQGAEFENTNVGVDYGVVEDNTYVGETVVTEPVAQPQVEVLQEPVTATIEQAPVQVEAQPQPQPPTPQVAQAPAEEIPQEELNFPRITVKTADLKSALSKADVVAGKNDLQPVTEVAVLRVVGGNVQVRSSDRDNVITVYIPYIEATEGASMTIKLSESKPLIDKIKSETMTFVIKDRNATLYAGPGVYNINQALDLVTNEIIVIPDIEEMGPVPIETAIEITKEQFMNPIEQVFPLVAKVDKDALYAAVHIGNKVSASTGDEVAAVFENLTTIFNSTIFLKSTTVKSLISIGVPDKFKVGLGEINGRQTICIYTNEYRLYAVAKENEEEYPAEEIETLLSSPVGASVVMNKSQLVDTMDRLCTYFQNSARKILDFEKVGDRTLYVINESNGKEAVLISGNGTLAIKLDAERLNIVAKAISTGDLVIEPIVDGDGPVSFVRISSTDKKQTFVIGATLQ